VVIPVIIVTWNQWFLLFPAFNILEAVGIQENIPARQNADRFPVYDAQDLIGCRIIE